MTRRTLILISLVATLGIVAAGCGGGDEETAATDIATTAPVETGALDTGAVDTGAVATDATTDVTTGAASGEAVPATDWADSVCTALSGWQSELTAGAPTIEDATDVGNVQQTLVDYLDSVVSSTESMIGEVEAAGYPDVDQGESIAQDFQQALQPVRDSFEQARDDVEGLDASDPAFTEQLTSIGNELTAAGQQAASAFDDLADQYPESGLDEAAAEAPSCQTLGTP